MARTKIGAIITLDGEAKFKASLQACKSSISSTRQEIKTLQSSYKGNLNSLEALTEVQKKYSKIQETASKEIVKVSEKYKEAAKKTETVKTEMNALQSVYDKEVRKLEELRKSETKNAEALTKQEKVVAEAKKAYEQHAVAVDKCKTREERYKKELSQLQKTEIDAGNAVKKYTTYIKEAESSADKCAKSMNNMGKEMQVINVSGGDGGGLDESAMMGAVTKGNLIAGIASTIVSKIAEVSAQAVQMSYDVGTAFETSMDKTAALSSATTAQLDALGDRAEELGAKTKYSASQASDAFGYMALAGWDTSEMLQGISPVLNLASVGTMELAQASDMVTDYLSAFGMSAKDTVYFVDLLAYAQANSNSSVEQFGNAYRNCAANMTAAGQSIKTTTAFLATFANQGVKAENAGVKLTAVVRDLRKKAKEGAIEINNQNIAIRDSAGDYRNLIDIMSDVEKAVGNLGTQERDTALGAIFTRDSIAAVNMVLNAGVQSVRDYESSFDNVNGTAEKMAKTMTDNVEGAVAGLNSAVEALGNNLYKLYDGPLKAVIGGFTDMVRGISDFIGKRNEMLEGEPSAVEEIYKNNTTINDNSLNSYNTAKSNYDTYAEKDYTAYISKIEELSSKRQNLTIFDEHELQEALDKLSVNFAQFDNYAKSPAEFIKLTDEEIKNLVATAKQTDVKNLLDLNTSKLEEARKYQSLVNKQVKDNNSLLKEQKKRVEEAEKAYQDAVNNSVGSPLNNNEVYNNEIELENEKQLYADLITEQEKLTNQKKEANAEVEKEKKQLQELADAHDVVIDKNGKYVSGLELAEKAAEDSKKTASGLAETYDDTADSLTNLAELTEEESEKIKKSIKTNFGEAIESVTGFQSSLGNSLKGFSLFGSSDYVLDSYTKSAQLKLKEGLIPDAQINAMGMREYIKELQAIQNRTGNEEFVGYLASLGISADTLAQIHVIADSSDKELKELMGYYDEYMSYLNFTNESVKNLLESQVDIILDGIPSGRDAWRKYGMETAQGFTEVMDEVTAQIASGEFSGNMTDGIINSMIRKDEERAIKRKTEIANRTTEERNQAAMDLVKNFFSSASSAKKESDINVFVTVDGEVIDQSRQKASNNRSKMTGVR